MHNSVTTCCATIMLLLLLYRLPSGTDDSSAQIIDYGKSIDVALLDTALPSRPLEDWLRFGPPRLAVVEWAVSPDCDLKPPQEPAGAWPFCVKFHYMREHVGGSGVIRIGTNKKRISGEPQLLEMSVEPRERRKLASGNTYASYVSQKLSDLPLLLDEISYVVERREVIDYTRALDVSALDVRLSPQRLEDWLRSGPVQANTLAWGLRFECDREHVRGSACGKESSICADIEFRRSGVLTRVSVVVGTIGKGPAGAPRLVSVVVQPTSAENVAPEASTKLSDLPRMFRDMSAKVNRHHD